MKYKCIIFDCDGVLVDSEATSIGVILDIAQEAGFRMNMKDAMNEFSGQSLKYCFEFIEKAGHLQFTEAHYTAFRERSFAAYRNDLKAIPGIHNLLSRLTVPCCVASNAPLNKIELNLNLLKLTDFFDGNLFSAYQIEKWKPEPHLFLHAAKKMGFAPKECVVIEDSLAGVQAARAGGFDVFGYANKGTADTLEAAGAQVFFDMNKLDSLLV